MIVPVDLILGGGDGGGGERRRGETRACKCVASLNASNLGGSYMPNTL